MNYLGRFLLTMRATGYMGIYEFRQQEQIGEFFVKLNYNEYEYY
jgi:hypothetical protein